MERNDNFSKLQDLIKDIQFAMLTTRDRNGDFHSRPMVVQQSESDGDLWFMTSEQAHKITEIHEDPRVSVVMSEPKKQSYVAISGHAEHIKDRQKIHELWSPAYRSYFPEGPEDASICLIRVKIDNAEYWDSPSSPVVHLYGMAKAALTGEPTHPGEHEVVVEPKGLRPSSH